ncbi:hypothetical protein KUBF_30180 [Bacteroides finegoldii]|jgi:hypothetical protein|nr:hypothetical protein KUBF_30180 [Bacteroides finegoldii]
MKVTIKGKEYEFSFDSIWGPMYTYEVMAGKKLPFNPESTLCLHILYYCILCRANEGFTLSFEDFILSLNDITLVNAMSDYYVKRMEVLSETVESAEPEKKKRKSRKTLKV